MRLRCRLGEGAGPSPKPRGFRKAEPAPRLMVRFLLLPIDQFTRICRSDWGLRGRSALPLHTARAKKASTCVGEDGTMVSGLQSRQMARASAGAPAPLARRRPRRDGHRVRHRGDAVRSAAVRHHVRVPLLLRQLQPSRTRYGRRRAPSAPASCSSRRVPTPAPSPTRTARLPSRRPCATGRPTFLDCQSKAVVIVQSNANFSGISEPSCASNGTMINDAAAAFNPGAGSCVVLVTVCYPWESRRQAAVLQDGQPQRRLAADAGLRGLPLGALQLTPSTSPSPIPTIESTMSPRRQHSPGPLRPARSPLDSERCEGVAAVEFALIVPIMAIMFIGAVELSQAITVDRRVTQVASSTADLVARWSPPSGPADDGISQSEITDIMRVGGYHLAPYSANPLKIVLRSVIVLAHQRHQHQAVRGPAPINGAGSSLSCTCTNTSLRVAGQPGDHPRQRRHLRSHLQLQAAGVRLLHEDDGHRRRPPAPTSERDASTSSRARPDVNLLQTRQHALPDADLLRLCLRRRTPSPARVRSAAAASIARPAGLRLNRAVAIAEPADFHLCW